VAAFDAPGRAPRSGNARKIAGATLPRDLARGKRNYAVSAVRIAARRQLPHLCWTGLWTDCGKHAEKHANPLIAKEGAWSACFWAGFGATAAGTCSDRFRPLWMGVVATFHIRGTGLWIGCGKLSEKRAKSLIDKGSEVCLKIVQFGCGAGPAVNP
jgi:hypothetical protein